MDVISIVVPIYNVERYLPECIESIINQSYKNLEIVLVNDGSTDNCSDICDKYSLSDNRIKVITKENGGLSDARNVGIKNSTGKFIMFVDADDMLFEDSCEVLYREIKNKNADFITANYINITEDGKLYDYPMFNSSYSDTKLTFENKAISSILMSCSVWNKIFNAKFIKDNNINFVKDAIAEDSIFSNLCFLKAKNVYYIKDVIYKYRQRNITNKSISNNCSIDYFKKISDSYKIIYESYNWYNQIEYYKLYYSKCLTYILYKLIDAVNLNYNEKISAINELKWFFRLSSELDVKPYNEVLTLIVELILIENFDYCIKFLEYISKIRVKLTDKTKDELLQVDTINDIY